MYVTVFLWESGYNLLYIIQPSFKNYFIELFPFPPFNLLIHILKKSLTVRCSSRILPKNRCSTRKKRDSEKWRAALTALTMQEQPAPPMDKITLKTPNPKCRLYWCLIEFRDWRYSQSWWYFRPVVWTSAPLPSLQFTSPPFPVWIGTGLYSLYSV
jgi:hypothetical protein